MVGMECNKEEAIRAKEIAENKFRTKDIAGAKKFALKAQSLYPELEGISRMLATLDVYIAAENKINGEVNWYEILNASPEDDNETLKRKYRKLALILHPDKNNSIGAEGAFKHISEAWKFLSDKAKKLSYDRRNNLFIFFQKATSSNCDFHSFSKTRSTSNARKTTHKNYPTSQKNYPTAHKSHPTSQKSNPTSRKNQPMSQKNYPTTEKNHPTTRKSNPTARENNPTTHQNNPTSQKNQPTSQKNYPTTEKSHPTTQKSNPTTRENNLTAEKNNPTIHKNHSTTQKKNSSTKTNNPTTQKNHPTTSKQQPTSQENNPTFQKIDPTAQNNNPQKPHGNTPKTGQIDHHRTPLSSSTASGSSDQSESNTFWTICKKCMMNHKFVRLYLNSKLMCPNCQQSFSALQVPKPDKSSFNNIKQNSDPKSSTNDNTTSSSFNNSKCKFPRTRSETHAASVAQQAYEKVKEEPEEAKETERNQKENAKRKRSNDICAACFGECLKKRKVREETDLGCSGKIIYHLTSQSGENVGKLHRVETLSEFLKKIRIDKVMSK